MELKDLIGLHKLSGVTNDMKKFTQTWDKDETYDAEALTFILDGVAYTALEDHNDGYRSSMQDLKINEYECLNKFDAVDVFCIHYDKRGYNHCDILDIYDLKTAKVILSIGTDNSDDYYPSFVAYFQPENMIVNQR